MPPFWNRLTTNSRDTFDAHEGGFGGAPKFPRPVTLNFLTRFHARNPDSDSGQHALEMVLLTLRKMAAGGMHDQIGGGFHRYSVDAHWHVPHFEKMLYDQAQLASAFLDAFQITGDAEFAATARDILDYVRRDMTSPEGGFYSAEDADSPVPVAAVYDRRESQVGAHRAPLQKSAEGAFYVWTKEEIDDALGEDAPIFSFHYGVEENGNAPAGADPHGEFVGKNILIGRHSIAETARFRSTGVPPVGPTGVSPVDGRARRQSGHYWHRAGKSYFRSATNVLARIWTTKSSRLGTV